MSRRAGSRAWILIGGLLAACSVVPPSQPAVDILVEKEVSDLKIGLRSAQSSEPLRLYERMEQLGVGIVTIALVNEGELRWVRALAAEGEADADTPIAVGELIDIPRGLLALRADDAASDGDEELEKEIFGPLEMTRTRIAEAGLLSTAEDLSKIVTDLQKAHAGKPARRLRQEQAQVLFGTHGAVEPVRDLGFRVAGQGQAIHFERADRTETHVVRFVGFVYSGHGAVVIADHPDASALTDEILAGLAEIYDWPAYRVES
ncbi:MAG: hypothetical protein MPN21_24400 [Thermoanaerobaculia bacterium]|nr:hypothetical protein [Thermoanaerobaculia bacterium]